MDKQYYKIGEVAKLLGINSSTLRFWESEFRQLNPIKSSSNQRYYTPKHIEFLKQLKTMLYDEKYTIEGVKQKLLEGTPVVNQQVATLPANDAILNIDIIKKELLEIRELLK